MPWNDKSLRLRAARDRLNQKGQYQPSFSQSVALIIEILGLGYSGRNLTQCRKYVARLRDQNPDPTPDQIKLLATLDQRLNQRQLLVQARKEGRARVGRPRKLQPQPPTPPPVLIPENVIDPFSI
jgi:hypothetical protein